MPVFAKKKIGAETVLGVWRCDEDLESLKYQIQLDEEDTEKLNSFVNEKRKVHFLAVRALCKELIGSSKILYNEDGKPFKSITNIFISISHSHDFVAVIVGPSPYLGLDIQRFEDKIMRIRDRFVNDHERALIDYDDVEDLTRIWCAKESIYKIHGDRNVFFKEHMKVIEDSSTDDSCFLVELNHHHYNSVHRMVWEKFENYLLVYTDFQD